MAKPPSLEVPYHPDCCYCSHQLSFLDPHRPGVEATRWWPEYLIACTLLEAGLHPHLGQRIAMAFNPGYRHPEQLWRLNPPPRHKADIAMDPLVDQPTLVEYDSAHAHEGDSVAARDRQKNQDWTNCGWRVIRIREHPLEQLGADDFVFSGPAPSERDHNAPLLTAIVNHIVVVTQAEVRPFKGGGQRWYRWAG